ncbi:MAG: hypothetical protein K8S25_08210 [Alphaproteobacteria bacterium]|nr:hypothetical protein [Alphaproteobacteria bacterium]
MFRFVTVLRRQGHERADFWLSGQFDRRMRLSDDAIATWTEIMGRQSAELWLAARKQNKI